MQASFNYDCIPHVVHLNVLTASRSTGKERDTESGLDFFGARYYSSSMGRFMSPDWAAKAEPVPYAKLDNPQTLNLYGYVKNNPLSMSDPDGHVDWKLLKSAVQQILGSVSVKLAAGVGIEYGVKRNKVEAKAGAAAKGEWSISKKGQSFQVRGEAGVEAKAGHTKIGAMPSATLKLLDNGQRVDNPKVELDSGLEGGASGKTMSAMQGSKETSFGATAGDVGVVVEGAVSVDKKEIVEGAHDFVHAVVSNPPN